MKKLLVIPLLLFLAGCNMFKEEAQDEEVIVETNSEVILVGNALMHNSQGEVIGEILMKQTDKGVQFTTLLNNLPPGSHGIHVHEVGVCEAPDFESAGAHFNPDHKQHGIENENGPHAGDLPNLEVDADGSAQLTFQTHALTLKPSEPNSLFDENGSSIVIHELPDDYKTDPAGNSGARIACGIIK